MVNHNQFGPTFPPLSLEDKEIIRRYTTKEEWKSVKELVEMLGCSVPQVLSYRSKFPHDRFNCREFRKRRRKKRICKYCGKLFPLHYKNTNNKFCSHECYLKFNAMEGKYRKRIMVWNRICRKHDREMLKREQIWEKTKRKIKPCLECGKMTGRPKFCSDKCAIKGNSKKGNCKLCGKPISSTATYCSECYGKEMARKGEEQGNWAFPTRVFAKAICNLREIDREAYLRMRNTLTPEQLEKFDRILAKFHQKFNGFSYKSNGGSCSRLE